MPSTSTLALNETTIDPDLEPAYALHPLLEQEALLETFNRAGDDSQEEV